MEGNIILLYAARLTVDNREWAWHLEYSLWGVCGSLPPDRLLQNTREATLEK